MVEILEVSVLGKYFELCEIYSGTNVHILNQARDKLPSLFNKSEITVFFDVNADQTTIKKCGGEQSEKSERTKIMVV